MFKIALGTGSDISQRIYVKILTDEGIYGLGVITMSNGAGYGFEDYEF